MYRSTLYELIDNRPLKKYRQFFSVQARIQAFTVASARRLHKIYSIHTLRVNPLKRSGLRWLHREVFGAIQV